MLTALHRHMLMVERGIPEDLLHEEGVCSISSAAELPQTDLPLIHPSLQKLVAGDFWAKPKDRGPGILLPIRDVHGNLTWQYRPDQPLTFPSRKTGKPHVLKYESPKGVRNVIYVPQRVRADVLGGKRRLWVTEGVAKTLAGVAAGLCIVGMTGVSNWKMRLSDDLSVEIPDLADIPVNERVLVTAFDSDAITNKNVRAAELRWRREMEARGATVLEVRIPPGPNGEKVGLDDYLAAGGSPDDLIDEAIRRGWWDRPGSAPPPPPAGGSDGAETCISCQERATKDREDRAWDLLRKRGGWSPNEVSILQHYAQEAQSAVIRGAADAAIAVDDTIRVTGVSNAAITRAHKAYGALQADPEIRVTLPFTIKQMDPKPGDFRKPWHLFPARNDDGAVPSITEIAQQLATLLRPKMNPERQGDGRHGGARWACPTTEHAKYGVTEGVRRFFRCNAPGCTERWEARFEEIKHGHPDQERFHHENAPGSTQEALPEFSVADPFHDENTPQPVESGGQEPFHGDDPKSLTRSRHAENGSPRPLFLPAYVAARAQPPAGPPQRCPADGCRALEFNPQPDGSWRCTKSAHDPSMYQLAAVAGGSEE